MTQIQTPAQAANELEMSKIHLIEGANPRRKRSQSDWDALKNSIAAKGVLQAILVRPHPEMEGHYQVVAGNTRYGIAKELELDTIPANIRMVEDHEITDFALTENLIRADMSPVDEGLAVKKMMSEGYDKDEILRLFGWTKQRLDGRILLTHCCDEVNEALTNKEITLGHAQVLSGLRETTQTKVLKLIREQGLSVDDLKRRLDALSLSLAAAPFDTSACAACPHNSATQASLFDAGSQNSQCRNPTCYNEKTDKHLDMIKARLEETYNKVELSRDVPADTTTIIVANGKTGVGSEQVNACTGCEHFGAMIDTTAGNRARTINNVCYNLTCHKKKVDSYQKLIATDQQPASGGATSPESSAAGKPSASKTAKKGTTAKAEKPAIPKSILAKHHKVRREAAAKTLIDTNDQRSAQIICILALAAENPLVKVEGVKLPTSLHGKARQTAAMALAELSDEELNRVQRDLAAAVLHKSTQGSGENGSDTIGGLAEWYAATKEADLTQHFTVDEDYLAAFTKPVIGNLLVDSGFADHYNKAQGDDKAFTKLMKESKKDLLATVGKSGFDFKGYLPEGLKKG